MGTHLSLTTLYQLKKTQPVVQNKHMLSLNPSIVTSSRNSHSKTDTLNEQNMSTKGKELRTLELKLKKKGRTATNQGSNVKRRHEGKK